MAAHLDGKGVTVLDMTGLAQKGGAVFSHLRIADRPQDIHAVRIAAGEARCRHRRRPRRLRRAPKPLSHDAAQASPAPWSVAPRRRPPTSRAIPTGSFPWPAMQHSIAEATGADGADFVDATALAMALMGDAIAANLFLLGYAWQKGMVPVSAGGAGARRSN
ncbi:MAG: hypothetical protein MZW92_00560 [Comamonadaceae bacterium]|nr:hypothetical protein [Comamonadaceae bacterium]